MKRLLISALFIFTLAAYNSCDQPTEEQKEADALFQKITKVYTLHEDGSIDYRYKQELDLHSYYSFNSLYGETFIVYNPKYQDLSINKSVTETKEGEKIPSPENAYNEVLPGFASGAPPFSHLREMVVTHTGLEKNSTIHLDYELQNNPEFMPFLMGNEILAKASPVRELVIKVKFPADMELNYKLLNAQEKLNISSKGDQKEYKWVFKDIPATRHEDQQPGFNQHLPRLVFNTADLNRTYQYLTGQFSGDLPESIEESITNAVGNSTTRMDSILAIRDMVVNHINHFDIPLKHTGFRLRSHEAVLEDNGGTTPEKTVLLASILKKTGIDATPVGIIPSEFSKNNMGNLKTFEKYYVKVPDKGETVYLSAINSNRINAKYRYPDEVNLLLDHEKNAPERLKPGKNISRVEISGNLEINNANQLTGEVDARLTRCENPYLEMERTGASVQSLLSPGFNGSDVTNYQPDTLSPGMSQIHYTINREFMPEQQGNYRFMEIPEIKTGLDQWHLEILTESRSTPLELGWPVDVSYDYTLTVPEPLQLENQDVDIQQSNDIGSATIRIWQENGNIQVRRELQITEKTIQPADYNKLKELMNLWYKENYRRLIFTIGG
ncbi:MAG: DUF3857 domain-containing protein [Bacteroidota bacterium]